MLTPADLFLEFHILREFIYTSSYLKTAGLTPGTEADETLSRTSSDEPVHDLAIALARPSIRPHEGVIEK